MRRFVDPHPSPTRWTPRSRAVVCAAWLAAGLVVLSGGCGSSTDPGGGGGPGVTIGFTPEAIDLDLDLGQDVTLQVSVSGADDATVSWRRGGAEVGRGLSYVFRGDVAGVDTVRVQVSAGGEDSDRFWAVTVHPDPDLRPQAVSELSVAHGDQPIEVDVSWAAVPELHFPIAEYVVALSYDELVTAESWERVQHLATVPHVDGQDVYRLTFDRVAGALQPGEAAWFAVRVRDEAGQWSAVSANRYHTITAEWWISGTVSGDSLRTRLSGVIVRSLDPARNDNTDGTGFFRLGPYRSIDSVSVRTVSSGYSDVTTPFMRYPEGQDLELVLIRDYAIDMACGEMSFLDYFRDVIRKEPDPVTPTAPRRLWKPEQYPLTWFAPDTTNVMGVDLDELCRRSLARWDSTMGEPYFTEVANRDDAVVVFRFEANPSAYGRTELLLPDGFDYADGEVIPERIGVTVDAEQGDTEVFFRKFFQEVVIHEAGHVLGFLGHSPCNEAFGHLMRDAGGTGAFDREHPIHIDEQRVVRCVRYLPQGVDLTGYESP